MSIIAFIFARGGSKGLPGKNVRQFCGKPLIVRAIEQACSVQRIERVIVSTDSPEIASLAIRHGAEVPFMRPAYLARDETPEWLAWRHALNFVKETMGSLPEIMISLPTTAPLRLPLDIENCLDEYEKGGSDVVITVTDAHRSPYFNMVKIRDGGMVELACPLPASVSRRQDAPVVYDMTTVCYVVDPLFVMNNESIFEGRIKAVHVPVERAIDIDTLLDLQIAEKILEMTGRE